MTRRRGLALTIVMIIGSVVIMLGMIYTSFAVTENRLSNGVDMRRAARSLALSGLSHALGYMGDPSHWERVADERARDRYGRLATVDALRAVPADAGATWLAVPLAVTTSPSSQPGGPIVTLSARGAVPGADSGGGQWEVTVRPVTDAEGGGLPAHDLEVRASPWDRAGRPRGTFRVHARVRAQAAADYALFIGDASGWDRPNAPPPGLGAVTADRVGYTDGFESTGDLRVDGSGFTSREIAAGAGGINIWGSDVRFAGGAVISGERVRMPAGVDPRAVFSGSVTDRTRPMGLPPAEGYLTTRPGAEADASRMGLVERVAHPTSRVVVPDAWVERDTGKSVRVDWRRGGATTSDPLPGIPFVDVRLAPTRDGRSTQVSMEVRGYYSGRLLDSRRFSLEEISPDLLYVRGGNVRIQGELTGRLTVVADENPDRAIYDDRIYAPVYDRSRSKWYYPPPGKYSTREGNLCVTGDLTYGSASSALGLVSCNFIYLNDQQNRPGLSVSGVLTSFRHSVQYDWDNFARSTAGAKVTSGIFDFTGSITAKYADVEGDVSTRRGYTVQRIHYDRDLAGRTPPYLPTWDLAARTDAIAYRVLRYEEVGHDPGR